MQNYRRTKLSCYCAYLTMSSIFSLPPILFVTFHNMYGISYTLLGTLVLINFCTQLAIDLVFTFFTKYFKVKKTVTVMPLLTTAGLTLYAVLPTLFPQYAFAGLCIGTVFFSVASGLCECFISPIIAACPSDNPERDMARLHSLYAWGVFSVVIISTAFLYIFGTQNWMYLTLFFAALPVISSVMFARSDMPNMNMSGEKSGKSHAKKGIALTILFGCIFLGSASENVMTNWISGFMENALSISKTWCDIIGLALFALLLGTTRTLYSKYGKSISKVLLFGMIGAVICYVTVGLSSGTVLPLIACVITGVCTSMLWPGTLIFMEENLPGIGVAAYALMAAGGDMGASVAPQLMGSMVDIVSSSSLAVTLGNSLGLTAEQVGMKAGMLLSAVFPLLGIAVVLIAIRFFKKNKPS